MPSHCGPTSPPCSVPQHVPSLLFPAHSEPCDPRTRGESGRLAEHSPLTSAGVLSLRALELATSLPQYVCELARQAPPTSRSLGAAILQGTSIPQASRSWLRLCTFTSSCVSPVRAVHTPERLLDSVVFVTQRVCGGDSRSSGRLSGRHGASSGAAGGFDCAGTPPQRAPVGRAGALDSGCLCVVRVGAFLFSTARAAAAMKV